MAGPENNIGGVAGDDNVRRLVAADRGAEPSDRKSNSARRPALPDDVVARVHEQAAHVLKTARNQNDMVIGSGEIGKSACNRTAWRLR